MRRVSRDRTAFSRREPSGTSSSLALFTTSSKAKSTLLSLGTFATLVEFFLVRFLSIFMRPSAIAISMQTIYAFQFGLHH